MPTKPRGKAQKDGSNKVEGAKHASAQPSAPAPNITLRQLAHELNSLLDGSMRCVGLARESLQKPAPKSLATGPSAADDGLGKAQAAMAHMAALLKRALQHTLDTTSGSPAAVFDGLQSLGALLDELLPLLDAQAQASGVTLTTEIAAECSAIPAGPLGPVLLNGLRNAIEASALAGEGDRRVRLTIEQRDDGLHMRIENPSAARTQKPTGHRIGLDLARQIVRELGGDLALVNESHVTTLRVSVPIGSLQRDD